MDKETELRYLNILKEELVPAMGCTEPICMAYCGALAKHYFPWEVETVAVLVSKDMVKNAKSVVVPNTGGLKGIPASISAGIVAGRQDLYLEVISKIDEEDIKRIIDFMERIPIAVEESESGIPLDVSVTINGQGHHSRARIAGGHTNVLLIEQDGSIVFEKPVETNGKCCKTDHSFLSIAGIFEFANGVDVSLIKDTLDRQEALNVAIAHEGLNKPYGANIGKIILDSFGDSVFSKAKAYAAAASDARMSGCDLPVIINSGSGNQGLATSLPVIVYANELGVSEEAKLRALALANLVTIHLKTGIGCLSAYCGATSAGVGAGAGICYMHRNDLKTIEHAIVNALVINSGSVCDGAKPSCAAKIASSVEAGLLGMEMALNGSEFASGDGLVSSDVEATIHNIDRIAGEGMKEVDREIIELMTHGC